MFVYNYMAGKVDWLHGGDSEADYDPHKHRKVPKPTTYLETMIHVLKGAIGAGLLAMPYAISRLGIIVGPLAIVGIAAFATYCLQILVLAEYQLCKKWKRGYMSYPTALQLAVESGPPCLRWAAGICSASVDIFLVIWQIGVCTIFTIFPAENVQQICAIHGYHDSVRMFIIYLYPVQMVMCTIKDLKRLTPFSTIANFLVMIGMFLMFFYLIEEDIHFDESQLNVESLRDVPVFVGIVLFGLQAPGVILAAEHNMLEPARFTGICGLFSIAMTIVTSSFIALGLFGYFRYGDNCQASITLNLPSTEKKAQAAKLAVSGSIYLTYPLQTFVAWQVIWRKISKKFGKHSRLADYTLRFVLATFPFALGVASPNLGPIMGLTGAMCISVIAIIMPAIMDLSVYYPNQYGLCRYRLYVNILIILIGLLAAFSGIYSSLLEIIENS